MTSGTLRGAQMPVEDFEELARSAPETVSLEFLDGRIEVKKLPDGDHGAIIMWLIRQCIQARPDLDLHPEQGLVVESYRKGRARPHGVLAPVGHFAGQGEWADPEGVSMAVEITSYHQDTDRRDRAEKPAAYAAVGVPVCLLVDRDDSTVTVHAAPERGRYRETHTFDFGERVSLPEPVRIDLDTEILKRYVR